MQQHQQQQTGGRYSSGRNRLVFHQQNQQHQQHQHSHPSDNYQSNYQNNYQNNYEYSSSNDICGHPGNWYLGQQQQQQQQLQQDHIPNPYAQLVTAPGVLSPFISELLPLPRWTEETIASLTTMRPHEATQSPFNDLPDFDDTITSAIKNLSIDQRNNAYEDINGVAKVVEETRDFVAGKIVELNKAIKKSKTPAYDMAVEQNEQFVTNYKFLLMFLRSECFNAHNTAKRIMRHFDQKLTLFGKDKLTKRITLEDLTKEEQDVFAQAGTIQVLPLRDMSGRVVMFACEKDHRKYFRTDNPRLFNCRLIWYYVMAIIEDDIESQKKGIVYVGYGLDFKPKGDRDEFDVWMGGCAVANCAPVRITGFHYCYNNPVLKPIVNLISKGLAISARSRLRACYGSDLECRARLLGHGIPVAVLPLKPDKLEPDTRYLKVWIASQKQRELEFNGKTRITAECPDTDIRCDRGKPAQNHPGSKIFREVVLAKLPDFIKYEKDKVKKEVLFISLLIEFSERSMRFVDRPSEGASGWVECTLDRARNKIYDLLNRSKTAYNQSKAENQSEPAASKPKHGAKKARKTQPTVVDDHDEPESAEDRDIHDLPHQHITNASTFAELNTNATNLAPSTHNAHSPNECCTNFTSYF